MTRKRAHAGKPSGSEDGEVRQGKERKGTRVVSVDLGEGGECENCHFSPSLFFSLFFSSLFLFVSFFLFFKLIFFFLTSDS